jgi:threonine dehydrogenase-like Zn-dependent dehydrogenase
MRTWTWKGIDVVNAHERAPEAYLRGVREGLAAAARGTLDLGGLITHRLALDDLALALDLAERRPAGYVKAIVVP